jgi:hypothetical protein
MLIILLLLAVHGCLVIPALFYLVTRHPQGLPVFILFLAVFILFHL